MKIDKSAPVYTAADVVAGGYKIESGQAWPTLAFEFARVGENEPTTLLLVGNHSTLKRLSRRLDQAIQRAEKEARIAQSKHSQKKLSEISSSNIPLNDEGSIAEPETDPPEPVDVDRV